MPLQYADFAPLDPFPAHFPNALQEFLSSLGLGGVQLRIKPGASNTLQVHAGTGDAQVGVTINGRWRYITASAESTSSGSAGRRDVWVTAADNSYASSSVTIDDVVYPFEEDDTDYSFALAVTAGGAPPSGVDLYRGVGVAWWDGSQFTAVAPIVGAAQGLPAAQLVTALPSDPVDGQEVYYAADAVNGVLWHLRYNAGSSSSYKWEPVGGCTPLSVQDLFVVTTTTPSASTAFVDIALFAPAVFPTVPLGGEYELIYGAASGGSYSGTGTNSLVLAPKFGTAAIVGNESASILVQSGAFPGTEAMHGMLVRKVIDAGTLVKLQARTTLASGHCDVSGAYIRIMPLRVG